MFCFFSFVIFCVKGGKYMLNQVVLVGRIVKNPELRVTDNGKKVTTVTLAVPRSYKNSDGEYDTDFLDCTLWTNVAENTVQYCQTGNNTDQYYRLYATDPTYWTNFRNYIPPAQPSIGIPVQTVPAASGSGKY